MSRTVRVGYISDADPLHRWAWSGCHRYMFRALQAQGFDVRPIGGSNRHSPSPVTRVLRKVGLATAAAPAAPMLPMDQARSWARAIEAELKATDCDVLYAPVGSRLVALLQTRLPIVYLSDATFRVLRGYYPNISALPADVAEQQEEVERLAIANAAVAIFSSAWAAESAVRDYGADADRVRVIPLGANLDRVPPARHALGKATDEVCRLLFLGQDWARKGGDVALEAVGELQRLGVEAELTVCGGSPPDGSDLSHVRVLGVLNKRKRRDRAVLRRTLLDSHFLLLPTRADCTPIVFCEANAFGLPVITTRTGGIPSVIEEGRNGLLLSPEARGDDFARAIANVWRDDSRYRQLTRGSRATYDERLNWDAWAAATGKELRRLAAQRGEQEQQAA